MNKNVPIPHNSAVIVKYSMPITSFEESDYYIFRNQITDLAKYYISIGYEVVQIDFGINQSWQPGKYYARLYMNDAPLGASGVGTIIPTLGNIIESEDLLIHKAENYE